jgi:hypothetical protein
MPTIKTNQPVSRVIGRRFYAAVASLLLACVLAPAVHAQDAWSVNDSQANDKLSNIKDNTKGTNDDTTAMKNALGDSNAGGGKTVNANLDAINKKLFIGSANNNQPYKDTQPGPRVVDPDQALPASSSTAATLNDGSDCTQIPDAQQDNCKKIVAIQNAQYKYMLTMYENNKARDTMLRELLKERSNITADDVNQYGKLEDNTNKLTALYNLIALDQQQMATVNFAYDANLQFLRASQAQLARQANTGKPKASWTSINLPGVGAIDLSSQISGLISGVALTTALDSVQSTAPKGLQTLAIGKSNGW